MLCSGAAVQLGGGTLKLSRHNSYFNKQNELIRTLRKQLEATERELANQKWVFEQFLKSPSWSLTYPIRWLAKQIHAIRALLKGIVERKSKWSPTRPADADNIYAFPQY